MPLRNRLELYTAGCGYNDPRAADSLFHAHLLLALSISQCKYSAELGKKVSETFFKKIAIQ